MKLTLNRRIDVPASKAWSLLGERFGDVASFTTGLQASWLHGELAQGAVRTCRLPNGNEIQETLRIYSPETLSFKYELSRGAPLFLKGASNHWKITPAGENACDVHAQATASLAWWLTPLSPLMGIMLKRMGERFLDEIEHQLKTGKPHPRVAAQAAAG